MPLLMQVEVSKMQCRTDCDDNYDPDSEQTGEFRDSVNKQRNLSIPFYVCMVWKIRILFTMQFSVPFTITLKIRKMIVKNQLKQDIENGNLYDTCQI